MNIHERIKLRRKSLKLSADDVAEAIGVSRATYYRYESEEVEKMPTSVLEPLARILRTTPAALLGWDSQNEESSKSNVVDSHTYVNVPLYSYISCGTASFVEDNIEDYISLPESLLKASKDYFCQYAKGDSMIGENIHEGDLVIFEKVNTLDNGKIGCFCVDHNEATCKKFYHDKNSGIITLQASNPKYEPIIVTVETMNFRVLGQLALVINKR